MRYRTAKTVNFLTVNETDYFLVLKSLSLIIRYNINKANAQYEQFWNLENLKFLWNLFEVLSLKINKVNFYYLNWVVVVNWQII